MNEINEAIEASDRGAIADFGAFDAERLGLAVDTLISGALVVHWLISGQWLSLQHAHEHILKEKV